MVLSIRLVALRNSIQGVDIINSSNAFVGFWYNTKNSITHYFHLKSINDSLIQENTALHNRLAADGFTDTFEDVTAVIPITAIDSARLNRLQSDSTQEAGITFRQSNIRKIIKYAEYHYIPARVINNSIADDRMNYITLNRGSKDGIEPNMAVVIANGIVGRVVKVSNNYATVLSVLSEGRAYNAKLMDGTTGSIFWDNRSANSVSMTKIPKIADVQLGDSVFTTGYSIFPENVLIGTVAKIETDKKSNARTLRILLSTNFRNLQYVYVVRNNKVEEKKTLEADTKKDNKKRN